MEWPWLLCVVAVVTWFLCVVTSRYYRLLRAIPASRAPRFIGHALQFTDSNEILKTMMKIFDDANSPKNVIAVWAGPYAFVYLRELGDIEKLLTSTVQLRKAVNYTFLEPWLGKGLINSEDTTWQVHRKLITPSFHFKILEGFLETMISKFETLSEILDKRVGEGYFDLEPYIANYSLDIITETAMSTDIDAQRKNSQFVDCIKNLTEIIIVRSVQIWFFFDIIFKLSSYGRLEKKCTNYVNHFINNILQKKRAERKLEGKENSFQ